MLPDHLLLDTVQRQLANYNSFYELFAGLAAAFTGLKFVREYVVHRIDVVLRRYKDKIAWAYSWCDSYCNGYLIIVGNNQQTVDGDRYHRLLTDYKTGLENNGIELDKIYWKEKNRIEPITMATVIYVFFSCVFFILLGGLQADNPGGYDTYMTWLANFELFSCIGIPLIVYLSYKNERCYQSPIRLGFVLVSLLAVLACLVTTYSLHVLPVLGDSVLLLLSLIICISPILLLYYRSMVHIPLFRLARIYIFIKSVEYTIGKAEKILKKFLP